MFEKFGSTVTPVCLYTLAFETTTNTVTHFKNSMRDRLVKTMLVLSQSIMPTRINIFGQKVVHPAIPATTRTDAGGPISLLGHVDGFSGSKAGETRQNL